MNVWMCGCMDVWIDGCMHACILAYMHVGMYICTCVCINIYTHVYVYRYRVYGVSRFHIEEDASSQLRMLRCHLSVTCSTFGIHNQSQGFSVKQGLFI